MDRRWSIEATHLGEGIPHVLVIRVSILVTFQVLGESVAKCLLSYEILQHSKYRGALKERGHVANILYAERNAYLLVRNAIKYLKDFYRIRDADVQRMRRP